MAKIKNEKLKEVNGGMVRRDAIATNQNSFVMADNTERCVAYTVEQRYSHELPGMRSEDVILPKSLEADTCKIEGVCASCYADANTVKGLQNTTTKRFIK